MMEVANDHCVRSQLLQALNGGVGPHRSRYSAGDAAGRRIHRNPLYFLV